MLDRLRDRATLVLAETHLCTLATSGPAGIQASMVSCAGRGTTLYVLVPDTSDHLFNLEAEAEVAVTAKTWHLRGAAVIEKVCLDLFPTEQRRWHTVVRVTPLRLHIHADNEVVEHAETIDFEPENGE